MLEALIHGKLSREQENMEDILTSCVFGLLKHVPPRDGLLPFLMQARAIDGSHPLWSVLDTAAEVSYEFWPWWEHGSSVACEPDVVLRSTLPHGAKHIVLVEAKLHSGKSPCIRPENDGPTDQLAREWWHLERQAKLDGAKPTLVFLTAGFGVPVAELRASLDECSRWCVSSPRLCWLSWRYLWRIAEHSTHPLMRDLHALLERMQLRFWFGLRVPTGVRDAWSFPEPGYVWAAQSFQPTIPWAFQGRSYVWSTPLGPIESNWSFG